MFSDVKYNWQVTATPSASTGINPKHSRKANISSIDGHAETIKGKSPILEVWQAEIYSSKGDIKTSNDDNNRWTRDGQKKK